jgi:phosphoenolpyruvate synthase/pyruvate phosphate dikinase
MEFTKPFSGLNKKDANIAGGKGASLGEMAQSGIPVPDGFVVLSSTFDHFLRETDLAQEIDAILKTVDHKAIHTVESASEKIKSLIESREIPENIANEIKKQFESLNSELVAVRSSATAEDGEEHAWAGQLDSFLNTSEENLLDNVRKCWSSLFTPRAIFYRFEKGLHTADISVAVVIQNMVQSEISGVAFSVHPITEDPNQLIIEASSGLGEAVVSGSITPDSYVVGKNSNQILGKNIQVQNQYLTDAQILDLSNLVIKIERHFGFPCDIEWAFKNSNFYILQCRPITTIGSIKHPEGFISYENPIYPYFYTAVTKAPQNKYKDEYLMGGWYVKFRYGKTSLVEAPESSFDKYGEFFMDLLLQNDKDFTDFLFKTGNDVVNLAEKLEAINFNDLKSENVSDIEDFYYDYEKVFSNALGIGYSLDFALDKYIKKNSIDLANKRYHSFSQKEKYELKEIFQLSNPDDQSEKLANHILKYSWLQNDYSGEYRVDESYFLDRKDKILAENVDWSHTSLEKPQSLNEWIDFLTMVRDERKKCNLIVDGLLARYLKQECDRNNIEWNIAVMHTVEEFEELKNTGLRKYDGIRIVEIGHEGIKDISELQWQKSVGSKDIEEVDAIKGITANPGLVRGSAKIILSREDFHKIEQGDIVVASMTRPEFIQVLDKASAIVTNEGGITSHAAIISRELKKPCIIGTKIATKVIKDGDIVEVDANNGIVRILNKK